MSFEDILKLQNKVGTKVYNEVAYGGDKSQKSCKKKKRLNKNRWASDGQVTARGRLYDASNSDSSASGFWWQNETIARKQRPRRTNGCSASTTHRVCVCVFRPMEISAKRPAPFLRQVVSVRKPVSKENLPATASLFLSAAPNTRADSVSVCCLRSDVQRSSIWRPVGRIQAGDFWEDV